MVPESVSSLLGAEASEGLAQRGDDDSLSAESLDSVSHGKELEILVIKAHHHVPINKKSECVDRIHTQIYLSC